LHPIRKLAHLEVAVKQLISRVGVLSAVGALALAGALGQAAVANAATFSGKWSVSAVLDGTTNTASHATNSTGEVSSCVTVTSLEGVGGVWSYELIWFDGGKNKVLWHSGDFEGKATVCSPTKKPGRNDKVYDHIILENAGADPLVKDSGTYSINTH
jgi:hypothetical protein